MAYLHSATLHSPHSVIRGHTTRGIRLSLSSMVTFLHLSVLSFACFFTCALVSAVPNPNTIEMVAAAASPHFSVPLAVRAPFAPPKRSSMNAVTASLPPPNLPRSCSMSRLTSLTTLRPFRLRTRDNATYAICGSKMDSRFTIALSSVMPCDLWMVIAQAGSNGICVRATTLKGWRITELGILTDGVHHTLDVVLESHHRQWEIAGLLLHP